MKKPNIIVVGSANIDIVVTTKHFPQNGQTIQGQNFDAFPGGKGANQAVSAARLGANVTFIGCIGNDGFGDTVIESLKKEGIHTDAIQRVNMPTGTAIITLDEHANNQIIVIPGANFALTKESILTSLDSIEKPDALLLQLEIPIDVVTAAAVWGKKNGSLVILNPAPAPEQALPDELLKNIDYLIPNENESYTLTGEKTPLTAAGKLKRLGIPHVIITLSDKGALAYNGNADFVKPFAIQAIDPTASGDAFVAAISVATSQKKPLREALIYANAIGALTATKLGAQPSLPTSAEVVHFLENN